MTEPTITTTRRIYACQSCGAAYCHPVQYCFQCPGKMKALDLPYDYNEARRHGYKMDDFNAWLASHGLHDGGC